MRRSSLVVLLVLIALLFPQIVGAADAKPDSAGELPRGLDGEPLNLDFERGTLENWTAAGEAFARQPVKGDTVTARGRGMKSEHAGKFWVGGFEVSLSDAPQGTLTSAPFKVTEPWASFRVAGGSDKSTRVELVRRDTNKVIATRSGDNSETLKPVAVDLSKHVGEEIFIRLVDASSNGWGHLNFDDFKLHAKKPNFPSQPGEAPEDEYPFAGLSPEDAARQMRVPEGFQVTLAAGEPDVKQPIAMAIDDRGRLWIAEAYTYPLRAPEGKGRRPDPDLRRRRRRRAARQAKGVSGALEPRQRSGSRLRRRVDRRRAVFAVHSRSRRRRRARRPARGALGRLGLPGHARDAEHVHLGPRRLALRLPRRVHPLAGRQARHAQGRAGADQRRHLARTIPRGTSSRSLPTARAIPGASTSTTTARRLPRPASFRTCTTSSRAPDTSGRRASTSIRTPTTTSRRSPSIATGSAPRPTRATTARTPPAADTPMPAP